MLNGMKSMDTVNIARIENVQRLNQEREDREDAAVEAAEQAVEYLIQKTLARMSARRSPEALKDFERTSGPAEHHPLGLIPKPTLTRSTNWQTDLWGPQPTTPHSF